MKRSGWLVVGVSVALCYFFVTVGVQVSNKATDDLFTPQPSPRQPQRQQVAAVTYASPGNNNKSSAIAERSTTRRSNPVQCTLSNHASQSKIWERLLSRCLWCSPKVDTADINITTKPDFCDPAAATVRSNAPPAFDFSNIPSADGEFDPTHTTLTVVYSALGQRFFGPGGQSYVLDAIRQWRLFHPPPVSVVYLILDDNMTAVDAIQQASREHQFLLIKRSEIVTELWATYQRVFYVQGYMHPGGNRETGHKHFNQLVSERFFALHGVMRLKGLRHVLHFENDNIVYADMRPVVAAADRCGYALASIFANVKQVIPGVLYIRDAPAIERACQFINDFLSCGEAYGRRFTKKMKDYANDMTYLMTYYQLHGSEALGALPAWEHKSGENCMAEALWQPAGAAPDRSLGMLQPGERGVIFDVASFGQWYSFSVGADRPPLHVANGIRGRFLDATPPPKMSWAKDDQGRWVPSWNGYRLLSLHIHAKNLKEFLSDRSKQ